MNNAVKLALYIVLAIAAIGFGLAFYSEFKKNTAEKPDTSEEQGTAAVAETTTSAPPAVDTNAPVTADANAVTETTNAVVATNSTNDATNVVAQVTNEPPAETAATAAKPQKQSKGTMMAYLGAFLASVIILGLLVAYDVTQFLGNRTVDFLFNDDLKGVHNPEYEEAEALWANGKTLEAIQAFRDYLKKNPREQYVALRIAEIYEKDLNNLLAAALEYEQVLTHKLPRERWGWAAIHLCNIYSKMGKSDQTVALLRRIADEYSETAAAKKARKRLAMFESVGDETSLGMDMPEDPNAPDMPAAPAPKPKVTVRKVEKTEEAPASNLPPGFRPKK